MNVINGMSKLFGIYSDTVLKYTYNTVIKI